MNKRRKIVGLIRPENGKPNNIAELRILLKGWTQQQLAKAVDCSDARIGEIETGTKHPATLLLAMKICEALGCTLTEGFPNRDYTIPKEVKDVVLFDFAEDIKEMTRVAQ